MVLELPYMIPQLFKHSKDVSTGLGKDRLTGEIVVSKDGEGDFDSLIEALKSVKAGDTIKIKEGNYSYASLTIPSNVEIKGTSWGTTITITGGQGSINIRDKSNIIIRDLKIIWTATAGDNQGLVDLGQYGGAGSNSIFFENVYFVKSGAITGGSTNFIGAKSESGTTTNIKIMKCKFENIDSGNAEAIYDHVTSIGEISGNYAVGSINIFPSDYNETFSNLKIRNNRCQDIRMMSGINNIISNNHCRDIILTASNIPYPSFSIIKGNFCINTITIGVNCVSNSITANQTDTAIVNNGGATNIFAGNVVY